MSNFHVAVNPDHGQGQVHLRQFNPGSGQTWSPVEGKWLKVMKKLKFSDHRPRVFAECTDPSLVHARRADLHLYAPIPSLLPVPLLPVFGFSPVRFPLRSFRPYWWVSKDFRATSDGRLLCTVSHRDRNRPSRTCTTSFGRASCYTGVLAGRIPSHNAGTVAVWIQGRCEGTGILRHWGSIGYVRSDYILACAVCRAD